MILMNRKILKQNREQVPLQRMIWNKSTKASRLRGRAGSSASSKSKDRSKPSHRARLKAVKTLLGATRRSQRRPAHEPCSQWAECLPKARSRRRQRRLYRINNRRRIWRHRLIRRRRRIFGRRRRMVTVELAVAVAAVGSRSHADHSCSNRKK